MTRCVGLWLVCCGWAWCGPAAWAQDTAALEVEEVTFADRVAAGIATQVTREFAGGQPNPEGLMSADTLRVWPSDDGAVVRAAHHQISMTDPLLMAIGGAWSGVAVEVALWDQGVAIRNESEVVAGVTAGRRRSIQEAFGWSVRPGFMERMTLLGFRQVVHVLLPVAEDVEVRRTLYYEQHAHSLIAPAGRHVRVGEGYRYTVPYIHPDSAEMMRWQVEATVVDGLACDEVLEEVCVELRIVMTPEPDDFERDAYLWVEDEPPSTIDRPAVYGRREITLLLDPQTLHEHRREIIAHTRAWEPGPQGEPELTKDQPVNYVTWTTWSDGG